MEGVENQEKADENQALKDEKKEEKVKKFKKWLKKTPKLIKYIVLILVIVAVFILGTKYTEIFNHNETVTEFGFRDVGLLVTQEWYGRIVEDSKVDRKLFNLFSIPGTESRQLFSIDVEVSAAVDFEKIKYDVKRKSDNVIIVVSLPHAEIYNSSEVIGSFISYIDTESWFSRIDVEKNQEAREAIRKKAEDIALEQGLLTKADENAQKVITNMIKGNNLTKDYEVEFKYL